MQHNFNIHQIIEENLVQATFQPIVSLKSGGISGYEGLIRGIHPESRISISPIDLFSESPREGCTVRLDRLCRTTILDAFAREILPCEPDALLFINFESSVIDAGIVGSNHILDAVDQAGIPHESIVLEIIESRVFDTNRLKDFVTAYRQRGFLFALDDIGAGHSNLDRIGLVAPDIMKIDRALCAGISTSDIHREIFRALTQLGHNIGSLVLAEGVEEEDDVILASLLGADLHQGFYFGRPGFYAELDRQQCLTSISHAASLVKKNQVEYSQRRSTESIERDQAIATLISLLEKTPPTGHDEVLYNALQLVPGSECLYIIDRDGRQTSETVCTDHCFNHPETQRLFHPARKGTDHSFKEYSYITSRSASGRFTSDRYISLATGSLCRTEAWSFAGGELILCIDITDSIQT